MHILYYLYILDILDMKILSRLLNNCRKPDRQIGMELGISNGNSGLYRNDDGASYPYNIGSIMQITGSSASSPGYYYFYYNIFV